VSWDRSPGVPGFLDPQCSPINFDLLWPSSAWQPRLGTGVFLWESHAPISSGRGASAVLKSDKRIIIIIIVVVVYCASFVSWFVYLFVFLFVSLLAWLLRTTRPIFTKCDKTLASRPQFAFSPCFPHLETSMSPLDYALHPYELPEYCTNLHKKSFIIQSLYLYIWFFLTFVSCLLTVTLHIVDVRLTCLINITYLLTYLLIVF